MNKQMWTLNALKIGRSIKKKQSTNVKNICVVEVMRPNVETKKVN